MIKSSTVGKTNITPQIAVEWLEQLRYDVQRNVRKTKVEQLSRAITSHQFTGNTIKIARLNGVSYLVNGQHTLHAIVSAEIPVNLTVEEYVVESQDDIAELYYTTDIQNKRTLQDMYRTRGMSSNIGMSSPVMNSYGAALRLAVSGFDRHVAQMVSYDDLAELMVEWLPYANDYLNTVENCVLTSKNMRRKSIFSVGLVTSRYAPERSREFWSGVGNNDNLTGGDVRRTLHYYLIDLKVIGGMFETRLCRVIGRCWNAFCEGRQLTRIVTTAANQPVKLAETEVVI